MENMNLPPIPEDELNKINEPVTVDEQKVQSEESDENIKLPPVPEEQTMQPEKSSANDNSDTTKTVLSYICIAIGGLAFVLRGLAIYSVLFSVLVFVCSLAGVVCAIVSYKKDFLPSLLALIVTISACGSCLSLLASFVADVIFAPKQEVVEQDLSDIFGNDFMDPFSQFGEGQEDGSDYFWD